MTRARDGFETGDVFRTEISRIRRRRRRRFIIISHFFVIFKRRVVRLPTISCTAKKLLCVRVRWIDWTA